MRFPYPDNGEQFADFKKKFDRILNGEVSHRAEGVLTQFVECVESREDAKSYMREVQRAAIRDISSFSSDGEERKETIEDEKKYANALYRKAICYWIEDEYSG